MKTKGLTVFIFFVSILFLSCSTVMVPPEVSLSSDVPRNLSYSELTMTQSSSGNMAANMTVYNNSRRVRRLLYRVEWYTQDGYRIDSVMSRWNDFTIPSNGSYTIQAIAPDRSGTECRIHIRKGGL